MPLKSATSQYLTVTLSYWAFTLTDGALRMLILLFFHEQGYSPLELATLFLLYELFGMVTNLYGGWLGARIGLTLTMQFGLLLQIVALSLLLVDLTLMNAVYVMIAQAISGIAKDLNKMSAKSSIKWLLGDDEKNRLYRWVSLLTGSKNTLKGFGFFLGGTLLAAIGFKASILCMVILLVFTLLSGWLVLDRYQGSLKIKFSRLLSKNRTINRLSMARFFLFCSRDIWFVVALPVYLQTQLNWSFIEVSSLMASWVIFYGVIQALAPRITGEKKSRFPGRNTLVKWGACLSFLPALIALLLYMGMDPTLTLVMGLLVYGGCFAVNSSVHSYLIVSYAEREAVSLDVGFYYMANAGGRLLGTLLSGLLFQVSGLLSCLLLSTILIVFSTLAAQWIPGSDAENNTVRGSDD